MKQPLSPAAQAVLDAAVLPCTIRHAKAAALRALAEQAGSARHWHVNEIRAIAAELEGASPDCGEEASLHERFMEARHD